MKPMKPYITAFMILCFANFSSAQTPSYKQLWEKVSLHETNGLPKSALKIVTQISKKAEQENNPLQQIKVLLYKSKYAQTLEEDAQLSIVNAFKAKISQSTPPVKNVLENMLATLYWGYFKEHRYQFYKRTNTSQKVDPNDFRTWDLQTLFDEINLHYSNSLKNENILQDTRIDDFSLILNEQNDSKYYRPTIYDLLSHNALSFYSSTESSINKPAYKFEIDDTSYLTNATQFSLLKLESKDSESLQLNALKIYQKLIQFHLKDKTPLALVDVDISRLKFVSQNAVYENSETLLLETLKTSSDQLRNHEASSLYDFEIATIYYEQGMRYHSVCNPDVRWTTNKALAICNTVIKKYPESMGAKKCNILKQTILNDTLKIASETIIPNDVISKVLVSYKNLKALDFTIYNVDITDINIFNKLYQKEQKLNFIKNKTVYTQWSKPLKDEKDYQKHTTEVMIPKLKNGHYIILAKAKNRKETVAIQTLQVTDFAVVDASFSNENNYQVINRTNGMPQSDVTVSMTYKTNYDGDYITKQLVTDSKGFIRLSPSKSRYIDLSLALSKDKKTGYFGGYYVYANTDNDTNNPITYTPFLFTDRSIYRPGQTVFFKGIATKTEHDKTELYPNQIATVRCVNTNGEVVKTITLKTNDYGSVHGNFIIPRTGLTGNYMIDITCGAYSRTNISIEEYKRPTFETSFEPIARSLKVKDSIAVHGKALAFSGSTITNARVVYRVVRKVQFPDWYYWYKPYFNSKSQEITNGETYTNDKGEFKIDFIAQPDEGIDKSTLPIFHYEITADVTDINGETRSQTTTVNVGYHALIANITVQPKLDKTNNNHSILIETKNLNGAFVDAKGSLKIYKLKAPNRVLRPRPWPYPDYQELSQKEFITSFPNDAFESEEDPIQWSTETLVYETSFDTKASKEIALNNIKKWDSGLYKIVLESKDRFGQIVKAEKKTMVFSEADTSISDNALFEIKTNKNIYEVGDNIKLTLASAAKNIMVTLNIEKDSKIIKTMIVPLSNSKEILEIPVSQNDSGGFAIHYSYAAFNSFERGTLTIAVPYPKAELEIETLTFRDKLKPGANETWQFKIKGVDGDKVSAELLASMYDASLDQFKSHLWKFNPNLPVPYKAYNNTSNNRCFGTSQFNIYNSISKNLTPFQAQIYDQLNWFGLYLGRRYETKSYLKRSAVLSMQSDGMTIEEEAIVEDITSGNALEGQASGITVNNESRGEASLTSNDKLNFDTISIRKNFQETAFFFPQLHTDDEGNVSFSFTTPEALTKWKLQLLAHTKTLQSKITSLETVTQKELMVIPNAPRFLREGDNISISSKIANLTNKQLTGVAVLQLFDAITGVPIDDKLSNTDNKLDFEVSAQGNTNVNWILDIPYNIGAIEYKIIAKAGHYSDGEQNALPVLSNRLLVTETLPMWIKTNETKTFTLDKLATNNSSSLTHHKLSLEMTSNPAWYAVQALPYLMEYPYDCNEQTFSRYYANALAGHITTSNPRIKSVFDQWKNTGVLRSNLEHSPELKSILIQETPWLRDAQNEAEQKKRIALLFDLNTMSNELESAMRKLKDGQMRNGAWPWFKGGRANRYITQHIITGFGHLNKLAVSSKMQSTQNDIIKKALFYLDTEFIKEYNNIKKYDEKIDLNKDHLSYTQLHYLYMRSFFPEIEKTKEVQAITNYYHIQIQKYWHKRPLYAKGLMALILHRMNDTSHSNEILKSLQETSITSDEIGMYWKANTNSWHWYQAPIETQALMIEAFSEISKDIETIDHLKIWLLKHKQTNQWKTTKATTEAIYALLLQGSDWLSATDMVDIRIGGQNLEPSKLEAIAVEAGTGYFKTSWSPSEINPKMANITLTKKGNGIAWGSLYWQYFEDLDKITPAETALQLSKKLFKKTNTNTGERITEISTETELKVGDLVRVRIELRNDRDMEFIHMKDMRAAGLEPTNVLSQYKYQDGLGYYESTRDASTNFFFDYLPKGIYVFEYDLRVNNSGKMSNGITTIQSMYAPEFSSHSEGIRIRVD